MQKARLAGLLLSALDHLGELLDDDRKLGGLGVGLGEDLAVLGHQRPVGLVDPDVQSDGEAATVVVDNGAGVEEVGRADADDFEPADAARVGVDAAVGLEDRIDHEPVEVPVGHSADSGASVAVAIAQAPRIGELRERDRADEAALAGDAEAEVEAQASVGGSLEDGERGEAG